MHNPEIAIIGGGAAGFFAAIQLAKLLPNARMVIFEQSGEVLQKVKISGGGRCNVTHACYEPKELVKHYPRGEKELLGPFHKFGPAEMTAWLEKEGVRLKTESDGRIFPQSDSSQTIIDCFLYLTRKAGITVRKKEGLKDLQKQGDRWTLTTTVDTYTFDQILLACGSNKQIWDMLARHGHTIVPPVPSLFTFNIDSIWLKALQGISVNKVSLRIEKANLNAEGPLLITHWGLSGPAILKLSAWGARELADLQYKFELILNWFAEPTENVRILLKKFGSENREKQVDTLAPGLLPKRLWQRLCADFALLPGCKWKHLQENDYREMAESLTHQRFQVNGKSTFKDEFVTAGGVALNEIQFSNMQSKLHPGLYFAGEIINVDAITGGFNFQNAWTTAFLAARGMAVEYA
jgi:hypothetical protein